MGNKEVTIETFSKLKGQHVLIDRVVKRFIGIGSDNFDYLYIMWDGKKISFHTILDRISQLKDKIDIEDYNNMVRTSFLNDIDSEKRYSPYTSEAIKEVKEFSDKSKKRIEVEINEIKDFTLLAEICWDIK